MRGIVSVCVFVQVGTLTRQPGRTMADSLEATVTLAMKAATSEVTTHSLCILI